MKSHPAVDSIRSGELGSNPALLVPICMTLMGHISFLSLSFLS